LLAAYNGLPYIEDQINSILIQKYVYIKIFLSVGSPERLNDD